MPRAVAYLQRALAHPRADDIHPRVFVGIVHNLGAIYLLGDDSGLVPRDEARGVAYLRRAVAAGGTEAAQLLRKRGFSVA